MMFILFILISPEVSNDYITTVITKNEGISIGCQPFVCGQTYWLHGEHLEHVWGFLYNEIHVAQA